MTEKALIFICVYLALINAFSFAAVAYDKSISRLPRGSIRRIPEKAFVTLSFLGGSIGTLLAMLLFHHKTKTKGLLVAKVGVLFVFWTALILFALSRVQNIL